MTKMLDRRGFCGAMLGGAALLASNPARAFQAPASNEFLFRNVRVFNGRASELSSPMDVLVRGNTIAAVGTGGGAASATVIDGAGRTLMPGMIDAHWHLLLAGIPQPVMTFEDPNYVYLLATREARAGLMRGFTTVRDLGGPVFGLKRAIDEGIVPGPRIYPCGAMISQTAGHGDFRFHWELPRSPGGAPSHTEALGVAAIADSPDEVRLRAREQLRNGASQIKLMAGGGVSSPATSGTIQTMQYSEAELRAAVEAAADWGTYVTVHAYTPASIQRAIRAGVKCIDHGQLADEETVRMMADQGIWWSLQPLSYNTEVFQRMSPSSQQRALQVFAGTDNAYQMASRLNVKTAWGADILFNGAAAARQGDYVALLTRWMTPADALKMVTADNAELMALSGFINPYPGRLGVVEEGALADLILVNGNPLENLELVADPDSNFAIIMKDGAIFKNILPA
jgi:imidazolonepropionase-like amidohydrolase